MAWMPPGLVRPVVVPGSGDPLRSPWNAQVDPGSRPLLVAAFNGGFKMSQARGGYYAEGRMIDPLRSGAASLVIYADGSLDIGAWGSDVRMTPQVVSVRQNLLPLVADGRAERIGVSARRGERAR